MVANGHFVNLSITNKSKKIKLQNSIKSSEFYKNRIIFNTKNVSNNDKFVHKNLSQGCI